MAAMKNNAAQTIKLLGLLIICFEHIVFLNVNESRNIFIKNIWILGDIAMFYFSMSSAYFTAMRYQSASAMHGYWSRKISRIGLQFLFVNAIIFLYCVWARPEGVFSFHTLVVFLGLDGFLNWFRIHNQSPLGAGQWFITALFLFYVLYPVLDRTFRSKRSLNLLLGAAAVLACMGQSWLPYGHALWSTSFGFIAGFYSCRTGQSRRSAWWLVGLAVLIGVAGKLALFHMPVISYSIIALVGYALGQATLPREVPWLGWKIVRPLDAIFLPLFLIHMYFFFHTFVDQPYVNSLIILALDIVAAKMISMVYARLQNVIWPGR